MERMKSLMILFFVMWFISGCGGKSVENIIGNGYPYSSNEAILKHYNSTLENSCKVMGTDNPDLFKAPINHFRPANTESKYKMLEAEAPNKTGIRYRVGDKKEKDGTTTRTFTAKVNLKECTMAQFLTVAYNVFSLSGEDEKKMEAIFKKVVENHESRNDNVGQWDDKEKV